MRGRGGSRRVKSFALRQRRGTIRLVLDDCIEGMARLKPGSVDVVVTSPPYNAGKEYDTYDDSIPRDEYLGWTRRWGEQVAGVLSARGSFFLNIG